MIAPIGKTTLALLAIALAAAACSHDAKSPTAPGDRAASFACSTAQDAPLVVGGVSASPNTLWPPDHRMVAVTVSYAVSDACSRPTPTCALTVASSEPANGLGDGDTAPDWAIRSATAVDLRAERAGPEHGRVYTITVTCSDDSRTSATTTTVTVPHDQGQRT